MGSRFAVVCAHIVALSLLVGCQQSHPVVAVSVELAFSSAHIDFGAPIIGATVTRTVQIASHGSGAVRIDKVTIEPGGPTRDFNSPDEGTVSWVLAPSESRALTLAFTAFDDRPHSARLCIDSNDDRTKHACIDLTTRVEGNAVLCGCVVDAGVSGPQVPCALSSQKLKFASVNLGQTTSQAVAFENCGSGNRPLTVSAPTDLYLTSRVTGLKVAAFEDATLRSPGSFPAALQPSAVDDAGHRVFSKALYAAVSYAPLGLSGLPPTKLCLGYQTDAGPQTGCLDIEVESPTCPSGHVDLDQVASNGCECTVTPETCDGVDNDCNGLVDDIDADHDRFFACAGNGPRDCDDANANVNPGAAEVCNRTDDNCNGSIDEGVAIEFAQDQDGDHFAGPAAKLFACAPPGSGWQPADQVRSGDCNDTNSAIHPGAEEVCDTADNDCNGLIDDVDRDHDRSYSCSYWASRDCDDANSAIHPGATEVCDAVDNDCNGLIDDVDQDHDRYYACEFWAARDCDDSNASIHPGAAETCNLLDDNCNGFIDEGVTIDFAQDQDNDGYANPAAQRSACKPPSASWKPWSALSGYDCNDVNTTIHPGAPEKCNSADDDCNGLVDDGLPQLLVYLDLDGDGFAATNATEYHDCAVRTGFTQKRDANGDGQFDFDCNDSNVSIYPGAPELCDGLLNDCLRSVPDQTCPHECPGAWPVQVGTTSGEVLVAQLDQTDTELEVLVVGGGTTQVIGHDGNVKWKRAGSSYYSHPSVADVDLDGQLEVLNATGGVLSLYDGQTGATRAAFGGGVESEYWGTVGAADLDNDGFIDLFTEGNFRQGRALKLGPGLTVLSQATLTVPESQNMWLAQPFAYDLNGDGQVEVGWNTGSWQCTSGVDCRFRVPVLSANGSAFNDVEASFQVPFRDTGFGSEGAVPTVADLDHDGVPEILMRVTDKTGSGSGVWVWRLDGSVHPTLAGPLSISTRTLAPIDASGALTKGTLQSVAGPAVDLNGDGRFEIISAGRTGLVIQQGERVLPGYPAGAAGQTPVIADLDLDGTMEVLYIGTNDSRVHCTQLGPSTYRPLSIAGMGVQGWDRGAFMTRAFDPFEPNDPGARSVNLPALTRSNVVQSTRAFSLKPFRTKATSGAGWSKELVGLLGSKNDRDFYWGDGSAWFNATLETPSWAPVDYELKAHFYSAATGAYAGTLTSAKPGGDSLYCHRATTPCPTGNDPYRVVVEVYPKNPATDFGPWPYQLVVYGPD